jgi:cytochrome P450
MNIAREYGDIAHFQIGSRRTFLLNHPDYIRDALGVYYEYFTKGRPRRRSRHFLGEGLLTSEGEFHRGQRQLIQPAFHKRQFEAHEAVIMEHGLLMRESWQHGQQIDVALEMKRLTMAIVSKILFDTKTDAEADEINEAVRLVLTQFSPFGSPFGNLLAKLPMSRARRIQKAQERLDTIIRRIIAERRLSGDDRGDLLSTLIFAQDETGNEAAMNDLHVRDETLTLFLAGHETMATALTWTWYLLARHPEVQAKLHAELDAVLASRSPALADIGQLRYTRMVFAESMRLYPPAWTLARYLIKDYEVGGYVMPAGSTVIISQYLMHHDPRYFPNPTHFDPQRWTPEAKAERPQYSYFPFGGGPRGCLGEGLAWVQGVLLIAALAQTWRMRLVPGHTVEVRPVITLQPKYGVKVSLERREAQSEDASATPYLSDAREPASRRASA